MTENPYDEYAEGSHGSLFERAKAAAEKWLGDVEQEHADDLDTLRIEAERLSGLLALVTHDRDVKGAEITALTSEVESLRERLAEFEADDDRILLYRTRFTAEDRGLFEIRDETNANTAARDVPRNALFGADSASGRPPQTSSGPR